MKIKKNLSLALFAAMCGSLFTYSTMAKTNEMKFLEIADVEHILVYFNKDKKNKDYPQPSIPKDWKLISVIPTNTGSNLWFQDAKGNVYSGLSQTDPQQGRVFLSSKVFRIPAEE